VNHHPRVRRGVELPLLWKGFPGTARDERISNKPIRVRLARVLEASMHPKDLGVSELWF
jgi:hypothetical protein